MDWNTGQLTTVARGIPLGLGYEAVANWLSIGRKNFNNIHFDYAPVPFLIFGGHLSVHTPKYHFYIDIYPIESL